VLWLLILRGVSIEFRSFEDNTLWREFWDTVFAFASTLLAIVLGTALGNVVRGVPLDPTGYFAIPLFTNFLPGRRPGVFDWYTLLVGFFTLVLLAGHGALYLTWKTTGPVHERSKAQARQLWQIVVPAWIMVSIATAIVQREAFTNLVARPWSIVLVLLMFAGLGGVFYFERKGRELAAFLSSSAFILGLLAATMSGNYPFWLRSSINPTNGLTAAKTATSSYSMQVGLTWWTIGMILTGSYFFYLFHSTRGKVTMGAGEHGY
jgi:cytochrome d ubiquinol oxidase subunit II